MMESLLIAILGYINPLKIIAYFRKPKLEIYYDAKETYHKAIDIAFNNVMTNWGHVMVRNKGKGKITAKNCVGKLQSIKLLKNNKFHIVPEYKNVMTLKWAHEEDFSPKDIEPNSSIRLDLCYIHESYDIIHFFTKKYSSGNQTDFPSGIYKIKIKINCDNAKSAENYFTVELKSGDFNSLKIDNIKI